MTHAERLHDTDAQGHQTREQLNTAGALRSLEDWVLSIVPPKAGVHMLDLGCGTGKLIFPYCDKILPGGTILGVDISPESVAEVRAIAAHTSRTARTRAPNVEATTVGLDDVVELLQGRQFDLIVSSYAIYYASNCVALLGDLAGLLADHGEVFVCGPGDGTNREMAELVQRVADDPESCPPPQPDFIDPRQIARAAEAYASVETFRLPNAIRFTDPDRLLGWWRNHNSHVPAADAAVEKTIRDFFQTRREFQLTKNVLGVLFRA